MTDGWKDPGQPLAEVAPDVDRVVVPFSDAGGTLQAPRTNGYGDERLTERYGEPVYVALDKDDLPIVKGVNEAYWAAHYADENVVLFEPNERNFYRYDAQTGLYSIVSTDSIKQVISGQMLEFSRREEDLVSLEKLRTDRTLNAVISQLRGITEQRDAFASRLPAVHLRNRMLRHLGVIGMIEAPFAPAFRSRNRSPIDFDPAATCPRFIEELVAPAVSAADLLVLQKMAGQFLLGQNLVQRFLVLDGEAARGKTQFANVLRNIVGVHNTVQLRTAHLGQRFETSRFLGRTLLVGADVEPDFLSKSGAEVIKALVGGDMLDAEKKNGNGVFRFKGDFNLMVTSNTRLKVKLQGDLGAWRRRMLIVRYEAPPPKRKIPNFAELLVNEEGSGILNWCVRGLELLFDDIREAGDIRLSEDQASRVDSLLAESDSLRIFLRGNVHRSPGSDLTVNEIMSAYAHFCPDQGWDPLPEQQIARQLRNLMLELFQVVQSHDCQRNRKSARGYRHVGFSTPGNSP